MGFIQHGVAHDPDLVPLCPGQIGFRLEVWLVMHEDLRATLRIRGSCSSHLAEGDERAFLPTSAANWYSPGHGDKAHARCPVLSTARPRAPWLRPNLNASARLNRPACAAPSPIS